jgi:hypothetical protein
MSEEGLYGTKWHIEVATQTIVFGMRDNAAL